jgi:hypothetical protein
MRYAKPELRMLPPAAMIVQSGAKGSVMINDSSFPHTTISAYEADE